MKTSIFGKGRKDNGDESHLDFFVHYLSNWYVKVQNNISMRTGNYLFLIIFSMVFLLVVSSAGL